MHEPRILGLQTRVATHRLFSIMKNPVTNIKLVYALAQRQARENPFSLTSDECAALELVGRRIHRLENTLKKK